MPHSAVLPFFLSRSKDVYSASSITSTRETVHGLLRLEGERVRIQWRVGRKTDRVGSEIRTDRELEEVREVIIPLEHLAGAAVRSPWWEWFRGPRLVLTASDLRALEDLAGEQGLRMDHPAEMVVRIRRRDRLAAEEFSAELSLAKAEQALEEGGGTRSVEAREDQRIAEGEGGNE